HRNLTCNLFETFAVMITIKLKEVFERLKFIQTEDESPETRLYKFILLSFVLGGINDYTTDWKRLTHNVYENKTRPIKKIKKTDLIKNVWKKFDLAKEGKEVYDFFRFLKSEAIKYDLQKCVIINGVKSKVNEALDSDDNIVKIICNWIQFSDLQIDDVILSGIIDTRKMSCSLKAHLELRGVWHLVNEEIIVHDIPTEFERHIERVVLDDNDRIPDKYY
ncbi:9093_t:CDS:2, partial [Gigaspora margarita]